MTDVKKRTAFITGGANGIGLGIARAFAREGAKLALADLDAPALEKAKAELEAITQVETAVLDVRDRDGFARVADTVEEKLGPVSLLFNNAGVIGAAQVHKITYELWDWVIGVNLTGVINGVQTFLPRMIKRREGGHIVNTSSAAGLAYTGSGSVYAASKYGVVGMSESLNMELERFGIGVSVLCPGPVTTDIVARTAKLKPDTGESMDDEQRKKTAVYIERYTKHLIDEGKSIDEVGEMVLSAVLNNRLYIYTDRWMIEPINARTKALLDAMPDA